MKVEQKESIPLELATIEDIGRELNGRRTARPYAFVYCGSDQRWQAIGDAMSEHDWDRMLEVLARAKSMAFSGEDAFSGEIDGLEFNGRSEFVPRWRERIAGYAREFLFFLAACATVAAILKFFG